MTVPSKEELKQQRDASRKRMRRAEKKAKDAKEWSEASDEQRAAIEANRKAQRDAKTLARKKQRSDKIERPQKKVREQSDMSVRPLTPHCDAYCVCVCVCGLEAKVSHRQEKANILGKRKESVARESAAMETRNIRRKVKGQVLLDMATAALDYTRELQEHRDTCLPYF